MTGVRPPAALPWLSTVARLGLAAVFLTAGLLKAADPSNAVAAVRAYRLLPPAAATVVGWGLPFVELALGLLLLVGLATRPAAVAGGVLLVVFLAGVVSAAARGLSIDCGCFGNGGAVAPDQTRYAAELARDLGFLVLVGWLVRFPVSRWSLDARGAPTSASTPDLGGPEPSPRTVRTDHPVRPRR